LIKLCQTFVIWTHGIYWLLLGHMKSGWKLSRVENCWDLNMITDKCFQALKMWKMGSGWNWHTRSRVTKTIVHKVIFLVLFGIFMKNAEGHLDFSFLTSTLFSLFHLNFPKANMKLHPLSARCGLSCLKFKRPGTIPLKQMSKSKHKWGS
jgi:hypothetical protein